MSYDYLWHTHLFSDIILIGDYDMAAAKIGEAEQFQEHLYKVLVIGDFGVGELLLSLVQRHDAIKARVSTL